MPDTLGDKYAALQMNPYERRRWAAFDTFCWQHIHQHLRGNPGWISQVRQGTVCIADRRKKTPTTPRHVVWDQQLSDIAYDLADTYAERIWPDQRQAPVHLFRTAPPGRPYMRATKMNMCINEKAAKKLEESGVILTEQVSTLESLIGQRIRDYLRCLVESDMPVPAEQPLKASQLLDIFLSVDVAQPSLPHPDHRHPPASKTSSDEQEEIEEGEIVEHTKRKLRNTFESEVEFEQLPRGLPNSHQQTGVTIGDFLGDYRQVKRRRNAVALRTSPSPSPFATSDKSTKDTSDRRSLSANLSLLENRAEVTSAASDDFQTGLGESGTCDNVSAYRCRLQGCNATFCTSQELHEHVEKQHSISSNSLSDAATALHGVSPQPCSPGLQTRADPAGAEADGGPKVQNVGTPLGGHDAMSDCEYLLLQGWIDEDYADLCRRSMALLRSQGKEC